MNFWADFCDHQIIIETFHSGSVTFPFFHFFDFSCRIHRHSRILVPSRYWISIRSMRRPLQTRISAISLVGAAGASSGSGPSHVDGA